MPVFPREILDSVIYLYNSPADARESRPGGGSGFLVSVPSSTSTNQHYYAVTSSHVIREGNSPIVRLNEPDGGTKIVVLSQADWIQHRDGEEVEICPLTPHLERHDYPGVPGQKFITPEWLAEWGVGPGMPVAMIGRFILHEGRGRNVPAVRFGHISMMPDEPIKHPSRGTKHKSFVLEMQSVSGYSGSLVVLELRDAPDVLYDAPPDAPHPRQAAQFLGVDYAHWDRYASVLTPDEHPHPEGLKVKLNTGMMKAVPAWHLDALIHSEEMKMERERQDKLWAS